MEEESYFNTSDDEDEESRVAPPSRPVPRPPKPAPFNRASLGSSRRKREPRKFYVWPPDEDPSLSVTATSPLVDYSDDDDEEKPETEAKQEVEGDDEAADALAGGFIRERRGAVDVGQASTSGADKPATMDVDEVAPTAVAPAPPKPSTTPTLASPPDPAVAAPDDDGAPPFLPSLSALKRKKEEDDDGELGLLAKRRTPSGGASRAPSSTDASKRSPEPNGKISLQLGRAKQPRIVMPTMSTVSKKLGTAEVSGAPAGEQVESKEDAAELNGAKAAADAAVKAAEGTGVEGSASPEKG